MQFATVLILATSAAVAAPVVCPNSAFSIAVGTAYTGAITCDGLVFSNFAVTNSTGNSVGRFDVNSISFDTGSSMVVLSGNPNLGAGGHIDLFYTVTGGVQQLDLSMGGVSGSVQERACAVPIPTAGINANLCVNSGGDIIAPLGQVNLSSGQLPQPVFSMSFPITSPIYVFKDISAGPSGGLSTINQSFHTGGNQGNLGNEVPEPATFGFLGAGLIAFAVYRRKSA